MNARPSRLVPHLWWWLAVLAGVSYCLPTWSGWHGSWIIAWKGTGVGLLAVQAALTARQLRVGAATTGKPQTANGGAAVSAAAITDAWLFTAVMVCGAAGDILLDAISLVAGAAWFALGHLLAMVLYWRNRRQPAGHGAHPSRECEAAGLQSPLLQQLQHWPFWLGVPAALGLTYVLSHNEPLAGVAMGYTLLVALMSAFAFNSRFPRQWVGLGAFLFLVSDLLLFTRTAGPMALRETAGMLVWPLYFGGQALIARGVATRLAATTA